MNNEAKNVLNRLLKGNEQFVSGKYDAKNITIETLKALADHQNPHCCVLSCSDSRVVPELIFEAGIGELFVVRVAGITVGPNVLESIEYAVKKLKVPLLMLLGHDNCGVMQFAKKEYPKTSDCFTSILNCVYPVFENKNEDFNDENALAKEHTLWVEKFLLQNSKIIQQAIKNNTLAIVKAHLCHKTGKVSII